MMTDFPTRRDRSRLLLVTCGLLASLAFLTAHYYRIQIIEGPLWEQKAARQHFLSVEESARRGIFTGMTAERSHPQQLLPLAFNMKRYRLYADPMSLPIEERASFLEELALRLDLSEEQQNFVSAQLLRKSRSRFLGIEIAETRRKELEIWWRQYAHRRKIPAHLLFCLPAWHRCHPYGPLAGQLLHTIQRPSDIGLQQKPTGGLELTFDSMLKGRPGKRRLMRSPRHTFESGEEMTPARHGSDIALTIDPFLQAIIEEELAKGVSRSGAKRGWALMMNPHTGAILAVGQYPSFNPDDYSDYFNDPSKRSDALLTTFCDAREPGSVMKPLTVAIALTANEQLEAQGLPPLFSPSEKIPTSNGHFPGRERPLQDGAHYRFLNMYMAIRKSSNIYMGRLVERLLAVLGPEWYARQFRTIFGLGQKGGIPFPAESAGVLPRPELFHPNGKPTWSTSTPFSLAIGYNLQATSLQLIRAHAVFANGGYLVEPRLVEGATVKRQVLSPSIVREVVTAMKYTTKNGGSCLRGDLYGYTEAGKSSTSKKVVGGKYSETLYTSSFIGFAPVENAAFILLTTLDEPSYGYFAGYGKNHNGGSCSAVLFRAIGRRALAYLGRPYDDPHGFPKGDPRRLGGTPDWVAETTQLQQMFETWNNSSH